MDWSVITENLACGGAPDLDGIRGLMRHDYTHILDLRHTTKDCDLYWMNFVYFRNPTFDDGGAKPVSWFQRSIDFAYEALRARGNPKLYVGCHSGLHRAPSTVYAILRVMGHTSDEAYSLLNVNRPGCVLRYRQDAERALRSNDSSERDS